MVHVPSRGCYRGAFHSTTCTVSALYVLDVTESTVDARPTARSTVELF